jgi:hypothetical protein
MHTSIETSSIMDNLVNRMVMDVVDDDKFRAQLETDTRQAFVDRGVHVASDLEFQVHTNTDDTFWFVFPPDPNVDLSDEALSAVAGGKSASSGGSAGSASTAGCLPSCASSAGSASTASSAASAS